MRTVCTDIGGSGIQAIQAEAGVPRAVVPRVAAPVLRSPSGLRVEEKLGRPHPDGRERPRSREHAAAGLGWASRNTAKPHARAFRPAPRHFVALLATEHVHTRSVCGMIEFARPLRGALPAHPTRLVRQLVSRQRRDGKGMHRLAGAPGPRPPGLRFAAEGTRLYSCGLHKRTQTHNF